MKQKALSLMQNFNIYDEHEQPVYTIKGNFSLIGRKLHLYQANTDNELAYFKESFSFFMPSFNIYIQDTLVASIKQEWSFLKPKFTIEALGWLIKREDLCEYTIYDKNQSVIATIKKRFFSWTDTFELHIPNPEHAIYVISIALAIDAVLDKKK
ncbi:hypothetical protein IR114_03615 [Granulicatella sp. 19428wC4_WM01]|uniref:LURP-one-related/scramblase family protein n=2 Tax=unclassified Granulicatella TaxID=2630493 RepID=UPI00107328D4|nr:hypothetical protein [Granulicatella sp. WM01]MBF0780173.1 hypothetical protein [Granulicatella sp. 19428wC4_WM01]